MEMKVVQTSIEERNKLEIEGKKWYHIDRPIELDDHDYNKTNNMLICLRCKTPSIYEECDNCSHTKYSYIFNSGDKYCCNLCNQIMSYWVCQCGTKNPIRQTIHSLYKKQEYQASSGCFIATAVYKSPYAPEVIILQNFRDEKLLTNSFGRKFTHIYYKYSPSFANYLSKHDFLSKLIKIIFINPLVWSVKYLKFLKNK